MNAVKTINTLTEARHSDRAHARLYALNVKLYRVEAMQRDLGGRYEREQISEALFVHQARRLDRIYGQVRRAYRRAYQWALDAEKIAREELTVYPVFAPEEATPDKELADGLRRQLRVDQFAVIMTRHPTKGTLYRFVFRDRFLDFLCEPIKATDAIERVRADGYRRKTVAGVSL